MLIAASSPEAETRPIDHAAGHPRVIGSAGDWTVAENVMGLRILVMESKPAVVAGLRSGLEREGHAVDRVDDGDAAVHFATERDYDVIVLDATDRPTDGYRVCQSLRDRGRWSPILLLTAPRHIEERIEGLNAGADDCLQTPFAFEELSARLRALARRRH